MASIRKRGSSYLIVVSMGYDYNGKRIKSQQKTVHPPEGLTPRQVEKWLKEQAVLFERDCHHTPQPIQQLTLAKYIDLWLNDYPREILSFMSSAEAFKIAFDRAA